MTRKHNFGAGPGILPESALQKAAADILNFNNSGMGVLEISHRSKDFEAVLQKAKSLDSTVDHAKMCVKCGNTGVIYGKELCHSCYFGFNKQQE